MKNYFRYFTIAVIAALMISWGGQHLRAQDTGKPAIRSIAYFTLGGGVLGAGLGVAYWMLDPLAPNADLRGSVLQGYGVGVFVGFIFGVMQLNKQAVFPYTEPVPPSEFEGNTQNFPREGNSYLYADQQRKPRSPQIPLLNFQYKF